MATPTELDVFKRCLGGDRRARTEVYKKFIYRNDRVTSLGVGYANLDDFLHDCLNHLLRTGHSLDKEESLASWVESVAVWTALIQERQRDMHVRVAQGEIRMCAEMEGEEVNPGDSPALYGPPFLGAKDSPSARILELLTDTEQAVFRKHAMENRTWDETAAATGKPLDAVGQIFARAAARIVRMFGAPPPLDYDLEPVVSRQFADPSKPEGRVISMQLDAVFYSPTAEMQSIGLRTVDEARVVVLWDAAQKSTPPGASLTRHLGRCRYCADLLRSLILMQQALRLPPGIEFRLCPGAFTLANAPDLVHEAFDRHLAQCSICRAERTQALDGQVQRQGVDPRLQSAAKTARKNLAWAAGVVALLLGAGSVAGYYYAHRADGRANAEVLSDKPHATVAVDPRYKDLVQDVPIDDAKIFASVLPANRASMKYAIDRLSIGQPSEALAVSADVARKGRDPGAQMIYAMSLVKTQLMTDGYREMLVSEAMLPRDSFRCWVMLQFALMVGDRPVIEREVQHLASDPVYNVKAKGILDRVRSRG